MKVYLKVILLIIVIAVSASFFASSHPDGLEWVAEKLGFIETAKESSSIMTDYTMPFIQHAGISTAVAGLAGVGLILGLLWGVKLFFTKLNPNHPARI
ncbi:MAG: PDGLE domain-containing protein [Candidatus Margulisbacteria bacterium]|nr:PDGLE domain-containing protein [Candidatus Margulisiibacteriota bacterium]MBU1021688.1 PDGLE domain-containing protein [Candidatus Margulisiibacteriota bacterium]MBU1729566.1 PDGLE domain-containing protein [Candidatus Margulisiibacteriota bacterium]MBU1955052.1 PDGLE domain-containing protein [Candidatus Margulisiibacteriota bacterium]